MGWFKIGDLFTLQMGKTPARSNSSFWGNGHIWVSISDLSNCNKYIASSRELITDDAVQESGIRIVPQGTLIMSFKLSLGKPPSLRVIYILMKLLWLLLIKRLYR